jgi:hypothetical protein
MNILYTRRPWPVRLATLVVDAVQRLVLEVRILVLRWNIDSTEQWLAECAADGLVDSLSLRHFRMQLQADRVQLAQLESQR